MGGKISKEEAKGKSLGFMLRDRGRDRICRKVTGSCVENAPSAATPP